MDGFLARGGAVALLTMGIALPAGAQGSVSVGAGRRDTIVRVIDGVARVRMDSVRALMRAIDGQPAMSESSVKHCARKLDAMMTAMAKGNLPFGATVGPRSSCRARGWRIAVRRDAQGLDWHGGRRSAVVRGDEFTGGPLRSSTSRIRSIVSVDRDSPAQLRRESSPVIHSIAYDGVDVVGRTLNLGQMLAHPIGRLGMTRVRRAGENKDYEVTVAKARRPMTVFLPCRWRFRRVPGSNRAANRSRVLQAAK